MTPGSDLIKAGAKEKESPPSPADASKTLKKVVTRRGSMKKMVPGGRQNCVFVRVRDSSFFVGADVFFVAILLSRSIFSTIYLFFCPSSSHSFFSNSMTMSISLSTNVDQCRSMSMPMSMPMSMSMSTDINQHQSLSTNINRNICNNINVTINQCQSMSISVNICLYL